MITGAALGRKLQEVGLRTPTIARTLADLAECYTRLHQVRLPGFGSLADDAQSGTHESWSQWQRLTIEEALTALEEADAVPATFPARARALCTSFAAYLDQAPGVLLNAEVGDGETFVDPATGAITAIVDWGSPLVGDPLYDLARLCPAGPRTTRGRLWCFRGCTPNTSPVMRTTRTTRGACCASTGSTSASSRPQWGEELGWTPSLVSWAEQLVDELGT